MIKQGKDNVAYGLEQQNKDQLEFVSGQGGRWGALRFLWTFASSEREVTIVAPQ